MVTEGEAAWGDAPGAVPSPVGALAAWLAWRKAGSPQERAEKAIEAAKQQHIALPGETRAAVLLGEPAHPLLALEERITADVREIRVTFRADDRAEIIESLPGMGPVRARSSSPSRETCRPTAMRAGRLAGHAGLASVPRDSGRRTGILRSDQ